uniref:Polynucleotide 5'-hydroxyl-kinase NOL9 n=1 Tax=Neolamprologus brichardi TaxID=32507 RepID=A0A3Q4G332_NEOBR
MALLSLELRRHMLRLMEAQCLPWTMTQMTHRTGRSIPSQCTGMVWKPQITPRMSGEVDWRERLCITVRRETIERTAQYLSCRRIRYASTLCFRGKCLLTCLYGRVEVMGFTIEEGQQSYSLFSPASHCPLSIRGLESIRALESRNEASHILQKYLPQGEQHTFSFMFEVRHLYWFFQITSHSYCVGLTVISRKTEYNSQCKFCSSLLVGVLQNCFVTESNHRRLCDKNIPKQNAHFGCFHENLTCYSLTGDIDGCPVILVCGTKNVGKSTFIRVLINTLLNYVEYLEGDLGQTEFTPAGCLSLLTVREPLLGPPFTHQQTPDHMIYYGQSSCNSDLDRYVESLKSLWCRRSQTREAPIIINTMGWVKGQCALPSLLVDMIRFFPVSHVVQLSHSGVNQCPALTPDFLRTANGFQTHPPAQTALDEFTESHSPPRIYSHISIQAEFQGRSNEQRNLSLLAYLSQLQCPDPGPVRPLHSLTPYQVPHTAIALGVTHCDVVPSHVFHASSGSLVGLCCLAEKVASKGGPVFLSQAPICPCVGFGLLRGIDMARGLYFLLTPVDPSVLRKVNCLLLGAISMPSCIFTTQVRSFFMFFILFSCYEKCFQLLKSHFRLFYFKAMLL